MKKTILIFFLGFLCISVNFGQILDMPIWLRSRMTIDDLKNELGSFEIRLKPSATGGRWFYFYINGIRHEFRMQEWGDYDLIYYSVSAIDINFNKLFEDLKNKYNILHYNTNTTIYGILHNSEITHNNGIELYNRGIRRIRIYNSNNRVFFSVYLETYLWSPWDYF